MILYLQMIPIFAKFCFYGCYCFAMGPFKLDESAGNAKPVDKPDNACRKHARCHTCAQMDFGEECDMFAPYKFEAVEDPVTKQKHIYCCKSYFSRINPPGLLYITQENFKIKPGTRPETRSSTILKINLSI